MLTYKQIYIEKLKDPRWQKKRLEILERDGFTCQYCSDKDSTLHVHHLHYLPNKDPWEYDNRYLITYCEKCHKDITVFNKDINPLIISEIMCGLKDPFVKSCTWQVLQQFDVNTLFYTLWEYQNKQDVLCKKLGLPKNHFKKQ
jgi:hypothetical protein